MIESYSKPSVLQKWEDIPLPADHEVSANHAPIKFSANTTLPEKIQRVFNNTMFVIVGLKLLTAIPAVAHASSVLNTAIFALIQQTALLQMPTVLAAIAIAPKIIVGLALLIVLRKVLVVVVCHIVYPAVLMSFSKQSLNDRRTTLFKNLNDQNFECRRIALNKSGVDYDSFAIEHEDTKGNGQWVMLAGGNGWIGETAMDNYLAQKFKKLGLNILYINGPGVGLSTGFPTSYTIGAGQEAGLQFLEEIEAKKILLYGTSLGGGAQAEAILNHSEFKEGVDYMVWSDRSFDNLSNAASAMVTSLAKPVFFLLGIELNGIAGAKKLKKLNIPHIVTQNSKEINQNNILPLEEDLLHDDSHDGVIPNKASLYVGLKKAHLQDSDRIKCYGNSWVGHNGPLDQNIQTLVEADIQVFLQD